MKLTGTAQYTLVNCCPCDLPVCPIPSIEVEHSVYRENYCAPMDPGPCETIIEDWSDWIAGGDAVSYRDNIMTPDPYDPELTPYLGVLELYKIRFRFVIPSSFTGVYYRVKWNTKTKPFTPPEGTPVTPSEDVDNVANDWTWTGPGDPDDAATWKSPWFYLDAPTGGEGFTQLTNIRYWCYRSERLGALPTILPREEL